MKKLATIISLLVYANIAFGITVDYHYCDKNLAGVSVLKFGIRGGCDCSKKGICRKCCKDKLYFAKADNHLTSQPVLLTGWDGFYIKPATINNQPLLQACQACSNGAALTNKRCCSDPIYLLNRVFRI